MRRAVASGARLAGLFGFALLALAAAPEARAQEGWRDGVPPDLRHGDRFRILFVTRTTFGRNQNHGIARLNRFVRNHPELEPFHDSFRAIASTEGTNARINSITGNSDHGGGVPIYWWQGERVADDYADLYDGAWASQEVCDQWGSLISADNDDGSLRRVLTGTGANGRTHERMRRNGNTTYGHPWRQGVELRLSTTQQRGHIYGLSGVRTVDRPGVTVDRGGERVALPDDRARRFTNDREPTAEFTVGVAPVNRIRIFNQRIVCTSQSGVEFEHTGRIQHGLAAGSHGYSTTIDFRRLPASAGRAYDTCKIRINETGSTETMEAAIPGFTLDTDPLVAEAVRLNNSGSGSGGAFVAGDKVEVLIGFRPRPDGSQEVLALDGAATLDVRIGSKEVTLETAEVETGADVGSPVTDLAGNPVADLNAPRNAFGPGAVAANRRVDARPPTLTISSDRTFTPGSRREVLLTFSEPVTGFTAEDIAVTGAEKGALLDLAELSKLIQEKSEYRLTLMLPAEAGEVTVAAAVSKTYAVAPIPVVTLEGLTVAGAPLPDHRLTGFAPTVVCGSDRAGTAVLVCEGFVHSATLQVEAGSSGNELDYDTYRRETDQFFSSGSIDNCVVRVSDDGAGPAKRRCRQALRAVAACRYADGRDG